MCNTSEYITYSLEYFLHHFIVMHGVAVYTEHKIARGGGGMIKFVPYRCLGWGYKDLPQYNWVAYMLLGNTCIFSGIDRVKRTSTVTAAGDIIENISKTEHVHWSQWQWFDFHGPWGYPLLLSGQFRLAHLELAYAPVDARKKSDHSLLIDGTRIYIVVRDAKEVFVKTWHYDIPKWPVTPIYERFAECAAAAMPAQ